MKNPSPKQVEMKVSKIEMEFTHEILLPPIGVQPLINFAEILNIRHSERVFEPISIQQLSEVLSLSSRVKETITNESGYELTYRNVPSAGARHPIEIFISSKTLFQNDKLFFYDAHEHLLKALNSDEIICKQLIDHLSDSFPNCNQATVIWLVAFPERTSAKYDNYESLVWRDMGALANTIHLTCTFFGLNSCISGTLGYPYITEIFSNYRILSGGALLIGSKNDHTV